MRSAALARQERLTKPPGSLGRLEELAVRLATMQSSQAPEVDSVTICIFAADHGIVEDGVSAFPQSVTTRMIENFARGGAAISVLADSLNATLEVVDAGARTNPGPLPGVLAQRIAPGTANFRYQAAMSEAQRDAALDIGRQAAERTAEQGSRLFVGGEMGIGNTTAASALACALLERPADALTGPGAGLDAAGLAHKGQLIQEALSFHGDHLRDPWEVGRRLGGFEILALAGAYVRCAQLGLPALVDGFIATAAALLAARLRPGIDSWLIYAHTSAEPGHQALLDALDAKPLLALGMRLGEGSGAAAAVPLLRLAADLHGRMATFEQAGISPG